MTRVERQNAKVSLVHKAAEEEKLSGSRSFKQGDYIKAVKRSVFTSLQFHFLNCWSSFPIYMTQIFNASLNWTLYEQQSGIMYIWEFFFYPDKDDLVSCAIISMRKFLSNSLNQAGLQTWKESAFFFDGCFKTSLNQFKTIESFFCFRKLTAWCLLKVDCYILKEKSEWQVYGGGWMCNDLGRSA